MKELTLELEVTVEYDYQPEEPAVMYDSNMTGYPGCGEDVEIVAIRIGDIDITKEVLRQHKASFIEGEIIELIHDYFESKGT